VNTLEITTFVEGGPGGSKKKNAAISALTRLFRDGRLKITRNCSFGASRFREIWISNFIKLFSNLAEF